MISAPDFLKGQLDLYGEQSGELVPCVVPHAEAMACRAVEHVVDFGLGLLARIQKENERWAADVEAGSVEFSWDASEVFAQRYRQWKEMSARILRAIKTCEESHHSFEQVQAFREAYRKVSLMALDTERTRSSIESLQAGRGVRHAEAIHELRSRMG